MKFKLFQPLFFCLIAFCIWSPASASNGYKKYEWGMSVHAVRKLAPDLTTNEFEMAAQVWCVEIIMKYFDLSVDGCFPFASVGTEEGYSSYVSKKQNLKFLFLDNRLVCVHLDNFGGGDPKLLQDRYGQVKVKNTWWGQGTGLFACWKDSGRLIVWISYTLTQWGITNNDVYYVDEKWFSKICKLTLDSYRRKKEEEKKEVLSKID